LTGRNILKLKVKINVRNIGLQPIEIIFKDESEKGEIRLETDLERIDYWRRIEKYYVQMDTYWHAYYNIPKEAISEFNKFIRSLEKEGNIKITYINTNPIEYNTKPNIDWFNDEERKWDFKWEEWIDEVIHGKEIEVPLIKSEEYMVLDKPDVFIIRKLEEDAETSFKEIASEMGVTPPTIRYHYYKHLIKYDIIKGYEAELKLYPEEISAHILTQIQFTSRKNMYTFLASLEGKPFTSRALINLENNIVVIYNYVPLDQIIELNKALIIMKKIGIIKDYSIGLIDRKVKKEKKLPMELYERGKWTVKF
ncbi:MAG: Lrp/AsnC family transcriptional regulator, partial [Candidatus Methanomethylicia archaeon]